jgi:CDP-diacylglycerol--glycerol-3-phosphate 3-phosphatidyltransferase
LTIVKIPNLISLLRLVAAPILLLLAAADRPTAYLVLLAAALLSDAVDGFLARRLGQTSELGARLDSWGDFAIYMTVPLGAWWLWPEVILREAPFAAAVVASYALPVAFGFLKYRRLTSYHTWGAKLSGVLLSVGAFLLFAGGPAWTFRLAVAVLVLAELEEIAITAVLPEWRANVPTLRQALRLRREIKG